MPLETLKNNRYRIVRPLGSGSTGEVYLAEDNVNQRQEVVLKLLHAYAYPATQEAQSAPRAFEFEARSIAQLNHPHILPLLDYGTEMIEGQVVPFIVTPYCRDGSLATWLEQRSSSDVLTLEDAARLVRQVADALQYAHNQGVIHRDVKSANVFIRNNLTGPPDMLVADFGFAQPIPEARASGLDIRGTPDYMAPEQWEGQVVPASDQYALGVMVYQLLTGRLPFQGTLEQVRQGHLQSWPTPPTTINPTLSPEIDVVVGRALAKKPGERYPTVTAFADAFTQAIRPAAPPPVYLAAPPTPPEGISVGNVTVTTPPAPARRLSTGMIVLITALILVVVLGGIAVAFAFSGNPTQSTVNATATANANITATANSNTNANTTATTTTDATATANTNATATASSSGNANATATANANTNATATASSSGNANATATANANATATIAPAAALSGNWTNADTNTKGITSMTITNNGLNVTVQTTSNFPTPNCNWGTKSNQFSSPFTIVFDVNNCGPTSTTETLTISMQGSQLKVVDASTTSSPKQNTYLLNKG